MTPELQTLPAQTLATLDHQASQLVIQRQEAEIQFRTYYLTQWSAYCWLDSYVTHLLKGTRGGVQNDVVCQRLTWLGFGNHLEDYVHELFIRKYGSCFTASRVALPTPDCLITDPHHNFLYVPGDGFSDIGRTGEGNLTAEQLLRVTNACPGSYNGQELISLLATPSCNLPPTAIVRLDPLLPLSSKEIDFFLTSLFRGFSPGLPSTDDIDWDHAIYWPSWTGSWFGISH